MDLAAWVNISETPGNRTAPLNLHGLTNVEFRLYGFSAIGAAGTARITDGANFGASGIDLAIFGEVNAGPPGPPPTNVQFTVASASIGEGGGSYAVTVFKTLASGNVIGSVSLGGSAVNPADFTINTTNFTLIGSVTAATFVISIVDDNSFEPSETISLALSNVTGGTVGSPSSFVLTILDNDQPPTNVITYQRFEAGDPWTIIEGAAQVSSASGAGDTPPLQRIQEGLNSWQVNNGSVTLILANASMAGYTNRYVRARVSSTSITAGNGADAGDFIRFYVALNGAAFGPVNQPEVGLNGNNNARWGYWATNSALGFAGVSNSILSPQGGMSSNNVSTVYIALPDAATSVALQVWAQNNDSNEVWNLDNIELLGDSGGPAYSPAQTAYIISWWGSISAYTGDAADDDGDGFSNLEEFIAGTIPVPPSGTTNYFRAIQIAITNAPTTLVTTPSVTGRLYRLWATPALAPTQSWSQISGPLVGTGGMLSLTNSAAATTRMFRLTVELENP